MYVGCKSGNVDYYVRPLPKAASSVIIVNLLSTLDIVRSLGKKAGHEGSTLWFEEATLGSCCIQSFIMYALGVYTMYFITTITKEHRESIE